MERKKALWSGLLVVACITFLCGIAIARGEVRREIPERFSWYGESGALKAPVYDAEKGGYWWIPEAAPEEKPEAEWGNRGYIFVGAKEVKPAEPPPPPPPAPEKRVVYRDRVVEKIVEKPVEKIVYRDRVVEKPVVKHAFLNMKDVYFAWDSAEITPLGAQTLKDNAAILREHPEVKVLLVGSASPEGASDYNHKLSERRVNAVKDFLVSKEKIDAARLQTKAKGEVEVEKISWPFARRVGFVVAK